MTARCDRTLPAFFFVFFVSLWFNRLTVTDTGYSIWQDVIGPEECDALLSRLADLGQQHSRAGARHMMSHPAVRALAADSRLIKLASEVLGHSATPYRATLFEKSSSADWLVPWHQDTALPLVNKVPASDWGPWSTKQGILYAHAPSWAPGAGHRVANPLGSFNARERAFTRDSRNPSAGSAPRRGHRQPCAAERQRGLPNRSRWSGSHEAADSPRFLQGSFRRAAKGDPHRVHGFPGPGVWYHTGHCLIGSARYFLNRSSNA